MADFLSFKSTNGLSPLQNLLKQMPSQVARSMSGLTESMVSTGLSLNSIKSVSASRLDDYINTSADFLTSSLDSMNARITQQNLVNGRSVAKASNDPSQISSSVRLLELEYPNKFKTSDPYITISFAKYDRPSPIEKFNFEPDLKVRFPTPRNLEENFTLNISPESTDIAGAFFNAGAKLAGYGEDYLAGRSTTINNSEMFNDAIGLAYYSIRDLASTAFGSTVANLGQQALGAIPNPHLSVFFKGVNLRPPMTFAWLFSPRENRESQDIKIILHEMKKRILPRTDAGNSQNIFQYPHLVKIELNGINNDSVNPQQLPRYKLGFISELNINYSPQGLTFFRNGIDPTFIVMNFSFQEVEIFTANDYGAEKIDVYEKIKENPMIDKALNFAKTGIDKAVDYTSSFIK